MQVLYGLDIFKLSENEITEFSEHSLELKLNKQIHDVTYSFLMKAANKHLKVSV